MPEIREPVLVVGAGQGLIVEELCNNGVGCDGVDFSPEMIKYARSRRGLALTNADARVMPFGNSAYKTVVYATGVIDFTPGEEDIRTILKEGRRVLDPSGKMFVAFYRLSAALENFLLRVELLRENCLLQRQSLETYLLNPLQTVTWVKKRAKTGSLGALAIMCRMTVGSTLQEKLSTIRMQRIFRHLDDPRAVINSSPEQVPYRNEPAIRGLFARLDLPILQLQNYTSCWVARI